MPYCHVIQSINGIVRLKTHVFGFLFFFFIFFFNLILFFNFTILYWFCHISTWIHHRYTRVPHPEPSSHLPPRSIPLGRPSAPAPSIQYHASNLDWRLKFNLSPLIKVGLPWKTNILYKKVCHCFLQWTWKMLCFINMKTGNTLLSSLLPIL